MKKQLVAVILVLILASFSCSIQNIQLETIDPQIVFVSEDLPANREESKLVFQMTGGEFLLRPGTEGFVAGTIKYNVEQWEPQFTRRDNYFEIKQVNPLRISGLPGSDTENIWDLELTQAVPLDLTIEGGASKNEFDFTGLQLTNLKILQGASETVIRFDSPNPQVLEDFTFTTGASSAKLYGLGHANFRSMSFSSGAGDYTLDFTGTLAQDASVDIKATISNITIVIPAGMNALVVNRGTVSNINARGTWLLKDDSYSTLEEGHALTINLDMAVGNVTLIHEE